MKVYQTSDIRNVTLLGGAGTGKTTLVEAMLFESGAIKRRGTVDGKNTVSDYFPVEQEYGYSVFPTIITTEWANKKINIIDCPGADDFIGGAISSLTVTDQAAILVNAQYGVEVGTQNQFRYADKMKKPVIFAINQLDKEMADFDKTFEQLRESFGGKVALVQYPVNAGTNFDAVVDVLKMKMYRWKPEGGQPEELDIPEAEKAKAAELHAALVEAAAENDESLMEKFFDQGSLPEEDIFVGIHKGLIDCGIYPVLCLCGGKSMGVRRFMDFLCAVAPSPAEMHAPVTTTGKEVKPDPAGPTSLFFFKTSIEPHIGEVLYYKVMSGKIKGGDDMVNISRNGSKERISQIFSVAGQTRTQVDEMVAGDIGATVKLKDVRTGNTMNGKDIDWVFPEVDYPAPKYRRAIKAQNESEDEKLGEILNRMHTEDPTWVIERSKELRQTILSGQGEFHLRTLKWRVENLDKVMIDFSEPRIPYRETITKAARADYRHKKQSGGAGQFDRQIHVDLPDVHERKEIFEVHLRPLKLDKDLDKDFLARQTPGFSGADIANVCNEAALIAARKNRSSVGKQDFLDAVDRIIGGLEKKNKIMTLEEKRSIAYHEAGHATISWLVEHGNPLVKVTIVPRGMALGAAWYLPEERQLTTREHILDEVCSLLGGRAAEKVFFDAASTGALNDLERATKQVYAMVAFYGMSDNLPNVSYYDSSGQYEYSFTKPYSETTSQSIDQEVKALMNEQFERAVSILTEHAEQVKQIAEILIEREVLFADDVKAILGERPWKSRSEEILGQETESV